MSDVMQEALAVTPKTAVEILSQFIEYNRKVIAEGLPLTKLKTAFLSSAPGMGKSAISKVVAERFKLPVVEVFLSEYDPAELAGFTYREGTSMKKARPDWLPSEGEGILILEEFSDAPQSVQNIGCRLVRERSLGEHKLAKGWHIIVCGNRAKDRTGAQQLVKKFTNRVCFLTLNQETDEFLDVAAEQGFHPAVIGYLAKNKGALNGFNPLHESSPTARSWEFVSDALNGMKLTDTALRATITGFIGGGEAGKFMGFLKHMHKIPDLNDIVRAPGSVPVPTDMDVQFATIVSLASQATVRNVGAILQYMDRFERRELAVFGVRYMHHRDKSLATSQPFTTWLGKNSKEFMV